jgi:hypothetical protein
MENLKENNNKSNYNKLSVIAFILSIGSFLVVRIIPILCLITILAGFIMGIIAIKKIRHTKEKGKWLAITAIVIGGIFILIGVWGFLTLILTVFGIQKNG